MRESPVKVATETIGSGVFDAKHPEAVQVMRPSSHNLPRSTAAIQVTALHAGHTTALFPSRALPRTTEFPQDAVS